MSANDFVTEKKPRFYCQTYNNLFEIRMPASTHGAQLRKNRAGKDVWFIAASSISGRIIDVAKCQHEYGPILRITLEKNFQELIFSTPWKSRLASGFLNRMPNIDYALDVTFDIAGGDRQSLFVKQNGQQVKWAYTLENPNGRPDWRRVELDGETVFDRSEQDAFFVRVIEADVMPRIQAAKERAIADAEPENIFSDASTGATSLLFDVSPDDGVIYPAPLPPKIGFSNGADVAADDLPF